TDVATFDGSVSNLPCIVDAASTGAVGRVEIHSDYTQSIKLQHSLTVGTTIQDGGTIYGFNSWIVPTGGVYNWNGGVLLGSGTALDLMVIQAGATMNVNALIASLDGRTIQNNGTISWNGGQGQLLTLNLVDSGRIQQLATFTIPNQGQYFISGDGSGTFFNSGGVLIADLATVSFMSNVQLI